MLGVLWTSIAYLLLQLVLVGLLDSILLDLGNVVTHVLLVVLFGSDHLVEGSHIGIRQVSSTVRQLDLEVSVLAVSEVDLFDDFLMVGLLKRSE